MALPPWTIELLRRGLSDAATRAREPEALKRLRSQASDLLQDFPETAARSIDRVIQSAEAGKQSVQKWSRKHTTLAVPLLNASGVLYHELGFGIPLAEHVTEVGQEMLRGDVVAGAGISERVSRRVRKSLSALEDVEVLVAGNFSAALSALSLIGIDRTLTVHRHHAVRLQDGTPLPEAFGTLLPVVDEVGAADGVEASDFEGIERACVIQADVGGEPVELLKLEDSEAIQAVVLPVATVVKSDSSLVPSAEEMLGKGAGVIVMPGHGLAGGPECGLIIGSRDELHNIATSASWPALQASDAVRAMMAVAIEAARSSKETSPLMKRLSTSEENLRDRAERLATRTGAADAVATVRVTADEALITRAGRWRLPSRQLTLTHRNLTPNQWASKLAGQMPMVATTVAGGALKLDLRWLDPAEDGAVADAICAP